MYFFPDVPICKVVQMNSWQLQGKESEQEIPGHGDHEGKHLRDYRDGVGQFGQGQGPGRRWTLCLCSSLVQLGLCGVTSTRGTVFHNVSCPGNRWCDVSSQLDWNFQTQPQLPAPTSHQLQPGNSGTMHGPTPLSEVWLVFPKQLLLKHFYTSRIPRQTIFQHPQICFSVYL